MLTVKSNDVNPEPLAPVNEATPFELAAMLVDWWVRCGNCPLPGLMFFGSKALWVLLSSLSVVGRDSKLDGVKKLRQQLGLIPVSEVTPFVWSVMLKRKGEMEWDISGEQRDGKQAFSLSGRVFFDKKLILPSGSVLQSCP
jgi:hypothetical protein